MNHATFVILERWISDELQGQTVIDGIIFLLFFFNKLRHNSLHQLLWATINNIDDDI